MAFTIIESDRCKGCSLCIGACPKKVLAIGTESNKSGYYTAVVVAPEKCIGCCLCAFMCPDCCITVDKWYILKINKDVMIQFT